MQRVDTNKPNRLPAQSAVSASAAPSSSRLPHTDATGTFTASAAPPVSRLPRTTDTVDAPAATADAAAAIPTPTAAIPSAFAAPAPVTNILKRERDSNDRKAAESVATSHRAPNKRLRRVPPAVAMSAALPPCELAMRPKGSWMAPYSVALNIVSNALQSARILPDLVQAYDEYNARASEIMFAAATNSTADPNADRVECVLSRPWAPKKVHVPTEPVECYRVDFTVLKEADGSYWAHTPKFVQGLLRLVCSTPCWDAINRGIDLLNKYFFLAADGTRSNNDLYCPALRALLLLAVSINGFDFAAMYAWAERFGVTAYVWDMCGAPDTDALNVWRDDFGTRSRARMQYLKTMESIPNDAADPFNIVLTRAMYTRICDVLDDAEDEAAVARDSTAPHSVRSTEGSGRVAHTNAKARKRRLVLGG